MCASSLFSLVSHAAAAFPAAFCIRLAFFSLAASDVSAPSACRRRARMVREGLRTGNGGLVGEETAVVAQDACLRNSAAAPLKLTNSDPQIICSVLAVRIQQLHLCQLLLLQLYTRKSVPLIQPAAFIVNNGPALDHTHMNGKTDLFLSFPVRLLACQFSNPYLSCRRHLSFRCGCPLRPPVLNLQTILRCRLLSRK